LAWLLSKRKIIFNALDSWYDRSILDRRAHSRFSPIAWSIWFVDFLAFHLSDLVLVESEQQKIFISKKFFVNRQKLKVVFTGVDETIFHPDPMIKKRERFTAVFRGMFLPATGVEYVIEAAKILKDEQVDFVIVGWGQLLAEVKDLLNKYKLPNVSLVSEFVEPNALRNLILSCHVMLGQFGDHSRLERTIQNKTLEALALGMPYITRDSESSRELLTTNVNCWFVSPADPVGIANAIKHLRGDEALLKRLAEGALAAYRSRLVPQISSNILIACIKALR
jgi:glycosyltransferase involved in cell wall biosynthesis